MNVKLQEVLRSVSTPVRSADEDESEQESALHVMSNMQSQVGDAPVGDALSGDVCGAIAAATTDEEFDSHEEALAATSAASTVTSVSLAHMMGEMMNETSGEHAGEVSGIHRDEECPLTPGQVGLSGYQFGQLMLELAEAKAKIERLEEELGEKNAEIVELKLEAHNAKLEGEE